MEKAIDHVFDLGNVRVARFVVNTLRENTYIIINKVREGLLIDCGVRREEEQQRMADFISSEGICLKHHLLTHAHFDHVWGAQWAFDNYGVKPTLLSEEYPNYPLAEMVMQRKLHRTDLRLPLPADPILVEDGHTATIDGVNLRFIYAPGHSIGGACLYDEANRLLFSGDCLFKGYIGLPKDPGLPAGFMAEVLEKRIYCLPTGTNVLPGHGPEFKL